MDYPSNIITGSSNSNEDAKVFVTVNVRAEFFPVDEDALTAHVQQWLLDNVPQVDTTSAERREQIYPVTALPPLPAT